MNTNKSAKSTTHNIKNLLRGIALTGTALTVIGLTGYGYTIQNKQTTIQYQKSMNQALKKNKQNTQKLNLNIYNRSGYFRRIGVLMLGPDLGKSMIKIYTSTTPKKYIRNTLPKNYNMETGKIKFDKTPQSKNSNVVKPIQKRPKIRYHGNSVIIHLPKCINRNQYTNPINFEQGYIQAIFSNYKVKDDWGYTISNNFQFNTKFLLVKLSGGDIIIPIQKSNVYKYTLGEKVKISLNTHSMWSTVKPALPESKVTQTIPFCMQLRNENKG